MRVLSPKDELKNFQSGLFLAGPATRTTSPIGWREEFIKVLECQGFTGTVLNPENPEYGTMGKEVYSIQTEWEQKGIKLSSYLVFWIPRSEQHLGLTTNIELGEWLEHPRTFIGWPPGSIKNEYIAERCRKIGKKIYSTMEEMVADIQIEQNKPPQIFCTSDTHFGAERTLHLSARPFRSVEEMDLKMISNWNKKVREKDVVFHLGDFGDWEIFPVLNCQKMYLVLGNYERKEGGIPNCHLIQILPNGKKVKLGEFEYRLVHEPLHGSEFSGSKDDFYLYGHIHRLQTIKRNGVNVGTDAHRWEPVSLKEIEFLRGGIEKHFDENVFCERVEA